MELSNSDFRNFCDSCRCNYFCRLHSNKTILQNLYLALGVTMITDPQVELGRLNCLCWQMLNIQISYKT
jgi:hypothetical protein